MFIEQIICLGADAVLVWCSSDASQVQNIPSYIYFINFEMTFLYFLILFIWYDIILKSSQFLSSQGVQFHYCPVGGNREAKTKVFIVLFYRFCSI